ncbi:DUF6953 family protein [Mycolicibacterium litorale]|uniref:DUF6953 family protein n=1 Tax=Mycolicibacterium litorale TaxID=758802 RepID=UPI003CF5DAD8
MATYLLLCSVFVIVLVAVVCVAVRFCDLDHVDLGATLWKPAVSVKVKRRAPQTAPAAGANLERRAASLGPMATAAEVAQWMVDHIRAEGLEHHDVMLQEIAEKFGDRWTPLNKHGHPIIDPEVQRLFRRLHAGTIERLGNEWSVVDPD